jgi:hypothetical protein
MLRKSNVCRSAANAGNTCVLMVYICRFAIAPGRRGGGIAMMVDPAGPAGVADRKITMFEVAPLRDGAWFHDRLREQMTEEPQCGFSAAM